MRSSRRCRRPQHCAAYFCANRRTIASRARGITFHKFPKDKRVRKKWEVALRRDGFTASDSSVLCCEHFKQSDFDKTGQIVRLRDGVIPSVFSFPVHLQKVGY
uniref:THAP-type domain-containing protein n=1 Tax=Gasterosteus aculeatus aculeatus TaxID=481459 RepID=A0AAQ4PZ14_GASAC